MKIYLIGPANLVDDETLKLYDAALVELEQQGHDVRNITTNVGWYRGDKTKCVAYRLQELFKCESVHVLPGWQSDPVAQLEMAAAVTASIPITYALGVSVPRKISFFTF